VVTTQVFRGKGNAPGLVAHRIEVVRRGVDSLSRDVLGKYVPGSCLCHDSPHFRPKIIRRL
jgi:hypothetical protein